MKIVCISDTHNYHALTELPAGDILLHAGDITRRGSLEEVERFDAWLAGLPFRHKVVIAGNHDWCFQRQPNEARARLSHAAYLEDEALTIEDIKLYGSPWQPEYHDWAFNLPRGAALAEKWARIPDDTDILITHGPPFGFGDIIRTGQRVGDEDLLAAVRRVRPALHLFGHVHEAYGSWVEGPTTLINASFLDPDFDPVNPAAHLEWQGGSVTLLRPLEPRPLDEPAPGVYRVKIRRLEPQAVMSRRFTAAPHELSARLGEVLPAIYRQIMSSDSRPMGPPFARYHGMAGGVFDIEAGLPVNEAFAADGGTEAGELPGGKAATTWHVGPYQKLGEAHEALERWVEEHSQEARGAPWEVYVTDPGAEPDPSRWRTRLFLPIR